MYLNNITTKDGIEPRNKENIPEDLCTQYNILWRGNLENRGRNKEENVVGC